MKNHKIKIAILITLLTALGLSGTIMSQVEERKFTVITSEQNITIRQYGPVIAARVFVKGERKSSISSGFKLLANYIFGNNNADQKIAMTAPVMQEKQSDKWQIQFIMPSEYSLKSLPIPKNSDVMLINIPAKKFVAIKFSGLMGQKSLDNNLALLQEYINKNKIQTVGEPVLAFYNPPWTIPFLRKNEIMMEIKSDSALNP